jgi:hypothetical protein
MFFLVQEGKKNFYMLYLLKIILLEIFFYYNNQTQNKLYFFFIKSLKLIFKLLNIKITIILIYNEQM